MVGRLAAASLLPLLQLGSSAAIPPAGSDPGLTILVADNNETCSGPPTVLSYHVHAVWDGADEDATTLALQKFSEFAAAMDEAGLLYNGDCPFSHPDGYAGGFDAICAFKFDDEASSFTPWTGTGLFGGANWAYYIPSAMYMRAMNWFRQHHDGLWYMMHVNTGCENEDHTAWSMKSMDYPDMDQQTTGLWCCHEGPPGCTCDIVQYAQTVKGDGAPSRCIASDADGLVTVVEACDGDSWALGTWRETKYTTEVNQFEIYNNHSGNVFLCLGLATDESCAEGAGVSLVDCGGLDDTASLIRWDDEQQQIVSDSCPGMCVHAGSSEQDGPVVLKPCTAASTWNRVFLD